MPDELIEDELIPDESTPAKSIQDELIEVLELVQRVQRAVHRSKSLHKPQLSTVATGLTMAQLRALITLDDGGQVTVGQLAERLGIGMPAASSIIDRLVEEGLADRRQDPVDRRRAVVRASPAGSESVAALRQGPKEVVLAVIGRMTPTEREHLRLGLHGFARAAEDAGDTTDADPSESACWTAGNSKT